MGADIVIAVDLNHDILYKGKKEKRTELLTKDSLAEKINHIISNSNIKAIHTLKEKYNNVEKSLSVKLKEWATDKNEMNIFEIIETSINIMGHRITNNNFKIHKPDILIQPSLGYLGLFDYDQAADTIEKGRIAAKREIDKHKALRGELNFINSILHRFL